MFKNIAKKAAVLVTAAMAVAGTCGSASAYNGPVAAKIPVSLSAGAGTNTFTITGLDPGNPMPADNTLSIAGSGNSYFEISYVEPGTYTYEITEQAGNEPGWTYDSTTYKAEVFVQNNEENEDALAASVFVYKDGSQEKSGGAAFENIAPTATPTPAPSSAPSTPSTGSPSSSAGSQAQPSATTAALDNVRTGDSSQPFLWGSTVVLAAAVIYSAVRRRKDEA